MKECPNCGGDGGRIFHRVAGVPVNSCLLFADSEAARGLARGDIDLAFCRRCGFVFNSAWQPGATVYSDLYEETQGFSATYSGFQRRVAEDLVRRHDMYGKKIVEIGCGKGGFLSLLCELGGNSGVGYDPAFRPDRRPTANTSVTFRREYFTAETDQEAVDFVCCRMTLEHISDTRTFLQAVRRIASPERGTVVYFQVPDIRRILREGAFWDVYYEHCSYFSPASLDRLFRLAGFDVLQIDSSYDDQYLTIEAVPVHGTALPAAAGDDVESLARAVEAYSATASACADQWASLMRNAARDGARTVLWGSGSKAVAFLSALGGDAKIEHLVDINPHRWGRFVPGTGRRVAAPAELSRNPPDLVIAMNPIYRAEIAAELDRHGCADAHLCALGDGPIRPVPATDLLPPAAAARPERPAVAAFAGP